MSVAMRGEAVLIQPAQYPCQRRGGLLAGLAKTPDAKGGGGFVLGDSARGVKVGSVAFLPTLSQIQKKRSLKNFLMRSLNAPADRKSINRYGPKILATTMKSVSLRPAQPVRNQNFRHVRLDSANIW